MIKIGSRVKFVSDTGTGTVRSISGGIAKIDVDGFEIPALLSDIVEVTREEENAAIMKIGPADPKPGREAKPASSPKDKPTGPGKKVARAVEHYGRISLVEDYEDDEPVYFKPSRRQNTSDTSVFSETDSGTVIDAGQPVVIEKAPFEETDYEVKLGFVPAAGHKSSTADLDAYLINDSSYSIYYNIAVWRKGYVETIASGLSRADSKEKIRTFLRQELAEIINLHISLLPFKATSFVPRGTEDFDLELHPLKFVRQGVFTENDYFDEPALLFTMASSSFKSQDEDEAGAKIPVKDRPKQKESATKPDMEVVDLHAENILDNSESLQPGEILKAQIARFIITLDGAIRNKKPSKIVFIHGVGTGKLKHEMKKVLDRQYSKLRYQDASFAEYGYGAIMVFTGK